METHLKRNRLSFPNGFEEVIARSLKTSLSLIHLLSNRGFQMEKKELDGDHILNAELI